MSTPNRYLQVVTPGPRPVRHESWFSASEPLSAVVRQAGVWAISIAAAAGSIFVVNRASQVFAERFDAAATATLRQACATYPHGSTDPVEAYVGGMEVMPSPAVRDGQARIEAAQRAYLAATTQRYVRELLGVTTTHCVAVANN